MFDDIEKEATRIASVASRVVEDFGSARGQAALPLVDDNLVVWLSRVIAQDVNIFDGANLLASSERNLFASGLLPTRTPGEAFREILLDGRPAFLGRETAGGLEYLIAAAPVHLQGREAVLTVPLTSRQQETQAQIEELDRRVLLAALLFIMLGASIGYYMAERIADPVNRLMRATRRIARGDLDARVLATSSDELRRLVEAFNQMAADLQRQRKELERTNRLAAWADMARQVAHDIKNPLTPIQLNAEHLRRVHVDQGRPMGGVIDECVANILGQVRLLRQISSEFSSFASSPEPKPVETNLAELVTEVVEPYRSGLAGRVAVVTAVPAALPQLRIDRMLIGRALTNVIENALHAMPGGGTLTVEASQDSGAFGAAARHGYRRRHGCRCAGEDLRAVFLDQGDRHRTRADDRQAERRSQPGDDYCHFGARSRHMGDHELFQFYLRCLGCLVLVLVAGCASNPTQPTRQWFSVQPFDLRPGSSARLADGLEIRFDGVPRRFAVSDERAMCLGG